MKKITRSQAEAMIQKFRKDYPDLLGLWESRNTYQATTVGTLTKKQQQQADKETRIYQDGFRSGTDSRNKEVSDLKAKLDSREHKIKALQEATKFLSVAGQTLGEFSRAMLSEADQH